MTRLTRFAAVKMRRLHAEDDMFPASVAAKAGLTIDQVDELEAGTSLVSVDTVLHLHNVLAPFLPDWIEEHISDCVREGGERHEHAKGPGKDQYVIRSYSGPVDILALTPEQVDGTACWICGDLIISTDHVLSTRFWVMSDVLSGRQFLDYEKYLHQHRNCRFTTLPCGCSTEKFTDTVDLILVKCPHCGHHGWLDVLIRGKPLPAELSWQTCPACGHAATADKALAQR